MVATELHWSSVFGIALPSESDEIYTGSETSAFEKVMRNYLPDLFDAQSDMLFQLVAMLNPSVLQENGFSVYNSVTGGATFDLDSQQVGLDTCDQGSSENTSSDKPCTKAVTIDDHDSVCHGRPQRRAGGDEGLLGTPAMVSRPSNFRMFGLKIDSGALMGTLCRTVMSSPLLMMYKDASSHRRMQRDQDRPSMSSDSDSNSNSGSNCDSEDGTSGLFLNDLVEWQRTSVLVLLSFTELAGRFDEAFIVKPIFPYEITFGFSP
ncbi:hypothetical protein PVL29_013735 [Vitis rotundifolia]|uniref:Uncharacterized protein n=1 Tax=Vitis rotundifolia TaxID=103349 RepID=A0AA39DNV1_VITRO|nr:hypothetical protein PVL29_013735 [Vitis rotundifolia]